MGYSQNNLPMKTKLLITAALALQMGLCFAQMNVNVAATKHIPCDTCVKLSATVTGGTAPYTYQWYINNHLYNTGQTISYCNKYPQTFNSDSMKLIVTDANSLQASYFNGIFNLITWTNINNSDPLCIVSVDSATGKNLLVWQQTNNPSIVSYNIYKQNTSSVFAVIANVPRSSFSTFIDTSSKPAQVSAMYNISIVDSCGFESLLTTATPINTIHLSISAGIPPAWNLSWNWTQGYPIVKYRIWRATIFHHPVLIDSVANSIYSYTDLTPPVGVLYYSIEAVSTVACNPSLKMPNTNSAYSSSFSNVANTNATGINEYYLNNKVSVFPNPSNGKFTIQANSYQLIANSPIEIYNVLGECIHQQICKSANQQIDLSGLKEGIYFLQVKTNEGVIASKIIVQR
jgi:hypothetical protein